MVDEICMEELTALAKTKIAAGPTGESAITSIALAVGLHQKRASSHSRLKKAMQMVMRVFR